MVLIPHQLRLCRLHPNLQPQQDPHLNLNQILQPYKMTFQDYHISKTLLLFTIL